MLCGNEIEAIPQADKRLLVYRREDLTVAVNPTLTEKKIDGAYNRILFSDGNVRLDGEELILSAQSACVIK